MYRRFSTAALLLSLALVATARADTTTEGIIRAIDLEKRAITFTKASGFTVVLRWTAEQEAKIIVTIDGDKATFKDLKRGQRVRLSYFRGNKVIYGIAILMPPPREELPKTAAKLKEIRKLLKEGEKEDAEKFLDELIKDLAE